MTLEFEPRKMPFVPDGAALPSRMTPALLPSMVWLPEDRASSDCNLMVAGLRGGNAAGSKVIWAACCKHWRRVPGPLSALLVTVQAPATAAVRVTVRWSGGRRAGAGPRRDAAANNPAGAAGAWDGEAKGATWRM